MPFQETDKGTRVRLRVKPNASRSKILGTVLRADGLTYLEVAVTAPPEDGKANKSIIELLAKSWKIKKSDISIISGEHSRDKVVLVLDNNSLIKTKFRK